MGLEAEIISKLCKVIDKFITIEQFLDWFIPATWDIPKEDVRAKKLAYTVKLRFAEYKNGHWGWDKLRERLIDLII